MIVAVIGFGIVRGLLWSREVRFFTAMLVLTLLYALGKYTPAFWAMYEACPAYRFIAARRMRHFPSA